MMNQLRYLRVSSILMLMMLAVFSISAGSVKMTVDAGRGSRNIEENGLFYIYLDVTDLDGTPETPKSVPGAKVMYFERTGQSSSFTSINGKTTQSSSQRYTLTLRALKEGSYSFGPISVAGVKSNVVNYTIGQSAANNNAMPGGNGQVPDRSSSSSKTNDKPQYIGKGDGNLFMRANVSKTSVYEQEALVYTVKLYTTYDAIKFIGAAAAPKFDGFVIEESKDISTSLNYETYNGKTYATAIIARYIIFPQITGQLKVQGNTYTVSVDEREYYHDPFWGSMSYSTPLQLNVTPNDLTVNVRPLPAPKPADFSGGVGKFKISSDLKSQNFKSNVAASVVYTVKGTGNLKYIQLPDLNTLYPAQLEVYSPKTDVKTNVGSSEVSGSVSFDYSFIPLEEGNFKIPPVKLVYFDPQTGKYETSTAEGYTIQVGRGEASSKSQVNRRVQFDDQIQRLIPGSLKSNQSPWVWKFGFWLFYIVPVLILSGAILIYRKYTSLHADMAAFNSKRADKLAKRKLKRANACMKAGDSEGFYTELLKALWGYMGNKLKMPTSELMRDNIRQVLEEKSVNKEVIDGFVGLLDKCEFAKYTPELSKVDMQEVYSEAIREINEIEKTFKG